MPDGNGGFNCKFFYLSIYIFYGCSSAHIMYTAMSNLSQYMKILVLMVLMFGRMYGSVQLIPLPSSQMVANQLPGFIGMRHVW